MKIKTVAYKGSKRKLLENIEHYAQEINATSFFDGFSGTGIVSAYMRQKGYLVTANDISSSSYIYGNVFLKSFDEEIVKNHLNIMNSLEPYSGWLTQNYSGTRQRIIRGTGGQMEERPLGFTVSNAMKLDAAREYIENLSDIKDKEKNALIFAVILTADKVFNNSNDQKSALKMWTKGSLKDARFLPPTYIEGLPGKQLKDNIERLSPCADIVYYDPPYTHGVLYPSCYHLNDSIAQWDKPILDYDYAIPRPKRVCFRANKKTAGAFYSKKEAQKSFATIIKAAACKRVVLSYSDAPRNTVTINDLVEVGKAFGKTRVESREHQLCTQFHSMEKISKNLKEFFVIIDKTNNTMEEK